MSSPDLPSILKDSHAFHYGQQFENRRIGEVIRHRITATRELRISGGLPDDIADGIIDELKALCVAIDEVR